MVDKEAAQQAGAMWNRVVGPYYTRETVMRDLRISAERLDELVAMGDILQVSFRGKTFLPAFQFAPDGALLPGLSPLLAILNPNSDPDVDWDVTLWLCTRMAVFGGGTAANLLMAGRIAAVLAEARATSTAGEQVAPGSLPGRDQSGRQTMN
ncbi:hypothetical protein ASE14_09610 [Agromyces sp. Root81]|uniref:hypothetical protein n=1 Tax=Agromyces sp. Root81 TaxID=1736601 RepID=UPI0006F51DCE|nr:hypothetical protein [Agromyces sp. Root81]KRC61175.1 hypothetical protein ASE14_09610 [Agromyces sp. Root81]